MNPRRTQDFLASEVSALALLAQKVLKLDRRAVTDDSRSRAARAVGAVVLLGMSAGFVTGSDASASAGNGSRGAESPMRPDSTLSDAGAEPASVFIAVSPVRVLDTRAGTGGPIGVPTAAMLGPGAQFDLTLAGDGAAVPANATAVLINVTIDDDATLASYLTIWPKGEPQPFTNNALPGSIAGNSMLAKLGNGGISIFNQRGRVNVVIDLVGYTVALSSVQQSGGRLLSGTAEPTSMLGNDGDYYIDTDDVTLFGPRRDGAWSMSGVRLAGGAVGSSGPSGARGATGAVGATGLGGILAGAGAFGGVAVNLTLGGSAPVPFTTQSPLFGTIAAVTSGSNTTGFTATAAGIYRVTYRLNVGLSSLGSVQISVGGSLVGPTNSILLSVATTVFDTVLISAAQGDVIEIRYTAGALAALAVNTSSSFEVERVN